jgi:hypothetical protein
MLKVTPCNMLKANCCDVLVFCAQAMPVALRDVGAGNVVYVVNQPGRSDIEGNPAFGASFGNKAIRAAFVRKVYTTLMLQLLTTVVFIAWFMFQ